MTSTRRAYCPKCGAQLRRGQPIGALCDPCQRGGPDPRQVLPADFYDQARIVAPLGVYDFGVFFRRLRTQADWSQQTLGTVVDMHQSQISAIERGAHRLRDIETIARLATRLVIPPVRLGFPDITATVIGGTTNERKVVSWVDRRDFGQHITALVLGATGVAGLDIDRLIALLPQSEPTGTRHVGAADVEAIEQATAEYQRWEYTYGGGMARDAIVGQLHSALPLLNAQIAPEVRGRLHVATAYLALLAAWTSFDVQLHDDARQLWMIGLDVTRNADDPQGADLIAHILMNMAQQSLYLRRPDEAQHLVQLGQTAGVGPQSISPSTSTCLAMNLAFAHAAHHDAAACRHALGKAEEAFTRINPSETTPWACVDGSGKLATWQGHAHYELARAGSDRSCLDLAVPLLQQAVNTPRAMSRALYLPELAGAHALAGDVDTAVTVGHQAVDAVAAVSSLRAHDQLRTLDTVLEPLHASAGVAELRDRLAATAA